MTSLWTRGGGANTEMSRNTSLTGMDPCPQLDSIRAALRSAIPIYTISVVYEPKSSKNIPNLIQEAWTARLSGAL